MGMLDFLNAKKFKDEITRLEKQLDTLKTEKLSIIQMNALDLKEDILSKETEIQKKNDVLQKLDDEQNNLQSKINKKNTELTLLEKQLIVTKDDIEMESFSLYRPQYDFATSLGYKDKLADIRMQQKVLIKEKVAVSYNSNWQVDGSKKKGQKMNNDNIKQILRSFNNECEAAINKVKFSNIDAIRKRIFTSFIQLNKLNETTQISIKDNFLNLKYDELTLAYEYELKKQDEKEELRAQREKEREEKILQKEIADKKKVLDKDIKHFNNMISEINDKISTNDDAEIIASLKKQLLDLENHIQDKESEKEELDYRTSNASAGYVYIISNIGAFGEDVVKIGVTRRLDPLERIAELSSASVPFRFDIHALIFSYDAYKLENDLHHYFDKKRINKVNNRKEFFKVSIDEIENKLKEYSDLTIDFSAVPDAEEYRQSI